MKWYVVAFGILLLLTGCYENQTLVGNAIYTSNYYTLTPEPVLLDADGGALHVDATDDIVYQTGYYSLNSGGWQAFTLETKGAEVGGWVFEGGTARIEIPAEAVETPHNYVILYTCSLLVEAWDCHGRQWQVRDFATQRVIPAPVCGNRIIEGDETCDFGLDNDMVCDPPYEGICSYCVDECSGLITLTGPQCGDGTCDSMHDEETICPVDCPIFEEPPEIDPKDIPTDRLPPGGFHNVHWQDPGIAAWTVVDVTTEGVQPGTDVGNAVNDLLDSVSERTILYFPPGEYRFASGGTLTLDDNIILRGAGPFETTFVQEGHGQIAAWGSGAQEVAVLVEDARAGDDVLLLDTVDGITEGTLVDVTYDLKKFSWCGDDCGGGVYEVVVVDELSSTIQLNMQLPVDVLVADDAKVWTINPKENIGIEGIFFDNKQDTGKTQIQLTRVKNAFVRDVHSRNTGKHHVAVAQSHRAIVENSYFDDAYDKGTGGNGYGVLVEARSTLVKVENNVLRNLRHNLLAQSSANHVIFGYNFNVDTTRDQCRVSNPPTWCDDDDHIEDVLNQRRESDMSVHGHYANSQLWEGNIWYWGNIDDVHEENGPNTVVFRNTMLGQPHHYGNWQEGVAFMIAGTVQDQTLVGNMIAGEVVIEPTVSGTFVGANVFDEVVHWSGGPGITGVTGLAPNSVLPDSLYLEEEPNFWFSGMTWPPYGPSELATNKIPAQVRYTSFLE